ncbi:MAG TPA: gamma-glutamyltransferase, partial [bacterium]|nr:gamma-glutamyltransferase [bacterium]
LAQRGFIVSAELSRLLTKYGTELKRHPSTAKIFFHPDGTAYQAGERLIQQDLANSLLKIASEGPQTFYRGPLAKLISDHILSQGGLITPSDLRNYQTVIRKPVRGTYRGFDVYSMPPPSSGGVHLIQMLNMLEPYSLSRMIPNSVDWIHLVVGVMQRAYADRSVHLGDPSFVQNPVTGLTSKGYARKQMRNFDIDHALSSQQIKPGIPLQAHEGDQTTHFSVIDKDGNAVSNTYTLNTNFGMKAVVPGTGILLNNEMDDFTTKEGAQNVYGLVQGAKNRIEPGKRMLSSMTPTIILKDKKPFLITGTPGGSRIITTVLNIILNVIDSKQSIVTATKAPRFHHQWLPDEIVVEPGFAPQTRTKLKTKGHHLKPSPPYCCA